MKIVNILLATILLSTTWAVYAEKTANIQTTSQEESKILLYAEDNDKKVIRSLSPTTHLVSIYQKGEWIKVGDTEDGTTGWVNQKQYQQALESFYQPDIQQVFISKSFDKDHKPQIQVVTYQNGKPVSENEAAALYEKIKKDQRVEEKTLSAMSEQMLRWQQKVMQDFSEDPFFNQPLWAPMPIFVVENDKNSKK